MSVLDAELGQRSVMSVSNGDICAALGRKKGSMRNARYA